VTLRRRTPAIRGRNACPGWRAQGFGPHVKPQGPTAPETRRPRLPGEEREEENASWCETASIVSCWLVNKRALVNKTTKKNGLTLLNAHGIFGRAPSITPHRTCWRAVRSYEARISTVACGVPADRAAPQIVPSGSHHRRPSAMVQALIGDDPRFLSDPIEIREGGYLLSLLKHFGPLRWRWKSGRVDGLGLVMEPDAGTATRRKWREQGRSVGRACRGSSL